MERRYRCGAGDVKGGRSTSQASRGYNPPRHREYAIHDSHGMERYAREADGSRRIRKIDLFGRDFDSRAGKVSDYDDRCRDKFRVHVGSPRSSNKRTHFDRDRDELPVGQSKRLHDEDQHHMDAFPPYVNGDFHADGSRRSNRDHIEDYGHTSFDGAGDADMNGDGDGRDYDPESRYSNGGGAGRLPMRRYLDGVRQFPVEYEREGRMRSGSYTMDNDSRDGGTRSHLETYEVGRDVSVEVGYFHLQNQLLVKKRDDVFHDREKSNLEINEFDHFQDGPCKDKVGKATSRCMKEENLSSSRDYVKNDYDFFYSLSQSEEYASSISGILMENFPGSSTARDIPMRSHKIQPVSQLASEPTSFNGYNEMQLYMSSRRPGDRRNDIRCSKPYILFGEKHVDHFYAEFGRSEFDSTSIQPRDEEEYRHHLSRMGDDPPWDPYYSSRGRSTPDKNHEHRSLHGRNRDQNMFGSGSSHLEYGSELTHVYGSMKYPEVVGGPLSPRSRGYEPSFGTLYDSPRKRSAPCEMSLGEPSERRVDYKHFRDELLFRGTSITTSEDGNDARNLHIQVNGRDEINGVSLRKKHGSGNLNYERGRKMPSQRNNHQGFPAKFIKSHSRNPLRSGSLVQIYKPSVKERLGPTPPTKEATLPWMIKKI